MAGPRRTIVAVMAATLIGAAAGALALQASYAWRPGFALEMDRPTPAVITGFHPEERVGAATYAWTRREVRMPLPGLDRRVDWNCTIRIRGGRADETTLPEVVTAVDGIVVGRHATSNEFLDIQVPIAPRQGRGATITLTVSNTFVPGGGDTRELGAYVDRWTCRPDENAFAIAPPAALRSAAIVAGAFGGVLALLSSAVWLIAVGIVGIAALQALPLTWNLGPFLMFAIPPSALGGTIAGGLAVAAVVGRRIRHRAFTPAGAWVLFMTAGALYIKLLALTHPDKLIIDVVFHAHRLMWVLDGRYFFTQPMPAGVTFPYAIGLYVFTLPWTLLTTDFVTLLRVVVVAAECAGGVLLYLLIVRFWNDRWAGAMAVTLYACVPRTYEIVGNANMTNAFGQSMALLVLTAATMWSLRLGHWRTWGGFILLLAGALLCHISTFATLTAILGVLAVLYWVAARPPLRNEAWALMSALALAAIIAVAVYYGHFRDSYRSAWRVRADQAASASVQSVGTPSTNAAGLVTKIEDASRLSVQAVGWPLVALAIPGLWVWIRRGWRDRFGLALAALGVTFTVFMIAFLMAPVDQSFQRYAVEFVSRITLATYPAMVVWAAAGAAWLWTRGLPGQLTSTVLVLSAGRLAILELLGWIS